MHEVERKPTLVSIVHFSLENALSHVYSDDSSMKTDTPIINPICDNLVSNLIVLDSTQTYTSVYKVGSRKCPF